jgi:hypothetical protein
MTVELSEVQRAIALVAEPESVVELRVLKAGRYRTVSGYYDDHQRLAQDAAQWSGQFNVYVTLNPVSRALLARSANKFTLYAEHTTKDEHIERFRWLLVDADPKRPAGISSGEAEHEAATERAREVSEWLRNKLGFPELPLADSGNGGHILIPTDLRNTPETTDLLKRCLGALAFRFNDEVVQIDQSTYNASRLVKLYGTLAVKGDPLPERPHRLAKLICVPDMLEAVSLDLLESLAATLPPEQPKAKSGGPTTAFDVAGFITRHALEVANSGAWNGAYKWALRVCPFNPEHSRGEAYILQYSNGAIVAGCLHQSCRDCSGQSWRELREKYEPNQHHKDEGEQRGADKQAKPAPRFTLTPLHALLAEPEEEVAYVWERTLPAGGVSMCAAKPKVGKSTLARNLALAITRGDDFLGRATAKGPVIYLCLEEKRAEVAAHFRRMGAQAELIFIHTGRAPDEALAALDAAIDEVKPSLIVIDPTARLLRVRDFNDYAEVARGMEPLIDLARATGCHILCVHHCGKGERDGGDALLGSTALFGAVDSLLIMKRRGQARTLQTIQRYGEDLAETVIHLNPDTGAVTAAGDLQALQLEERKKEVLDALGEDESLPEADIKERIGGKQGLTAQALRALHQEGKINRTGKGGKRDPFHYQKVSETSQDHAQDSGFSGFPISTNPENPQNPESSRA